MSHEDKSANVRTVGLFHCNKVWHGMKIISLVGARPQFIKEALVGAAVRQSRAWQHVLVHSGQHYDANMSDIFLRN